jgi:hypothetical protein
MREYSPVKKYRGLSMVIYSPGMYITFRKQGSPLLSDYYLFTGTLLLITLLLRKEEKLLSHFGTVEYHGYYDYYHYYYHWDYITTIGICRDSLREDCQLLT